MGRDKCTIGLSSRLYSIVTSGTVLSSSYRTSIASPLVLTDGSVGSFESCGQFLSLCVLPRCKFTGLHQRAKTFSSVCTYIKGETLRTMRLRCSSNRPVHRCTSQSIHIGSDLPIRPLLLALASLEIVIGLWASEVQSSSR